MPLIDPIRLASALRHVDDTRFAAVCNAVLAETAAPHMDRSHLRINLRITEPDGGVDAACERAPRPVGRLIPGADVVYQFRSGATPKSADAIAREDVLAKPRARAALEAGQVFVFVTAWSRGDAFGEQVAAAVRELGLAVSDEQIVHVGGDALAALLVRHPGIAAGVEGVDTPLAPLGRWAGFATMRTTFQSDADVAARLDGVRALLGPDRAVVRLVGAAGDGKTRTALEALRDPALADGVVYAENPDLVTPEFLAHLARTPDVRCTLVVDEADDRAADRLTNQWAAMPPGARLLLVGLDASGAAPPGTVQVAKLSGDLLTALVRSVITGAPDALCTRVAGASEGSPKLAVLLANQLRATPALAADPVWLADAGVRQMLDRFLSLDENGSEWEALAATALLTRVGWAGDAAVESEILFAAVNLDPARARQHVERVHERHGVAPRAGRYRYVSPQLLAEHLAARQLRSWTQGRFAAFFAALRPAMRDSFVRRLRGLSGVLEDRDAVERAIFGPDGPFATLDALEADAGSGWGGAAELLRRLAGAYPEAALRALERTVGAAPVADLRAATRSRRALVWALEELLWPAETFERAAALLLRLAAAENESWGNNATGVFTSTFQTMLGHTAAGPAARARVLQTAARSEDPAARRLSARAIGRAMNVRSESRTGRPPDDVPGMPREAWQPATFDEWTRLLTTYLGVLGPLLGDADASVRGAAAAAAANGVDAAIQFPWFTETWIEVARSFAAREDELRYVLVRRLEERLEGWLYRADRAARQPASPDPEAEAPEAEDAEPSAEEMRDRLRPLQALAAELRGGDFRSRLRAAFARRPALAAPSEAARQQALEAAEAELEALAREALAYPELLDAQWTWLEGDAEEAFHADRWIRVLARLDDGRVAVEHLARRARDGGPRDVGRLALYELVYVEARGGSAAIDRRAAEWRAAGLPAMLEFEMLARAGYTADRAARLAALLAAGNVDGRSVERLSYLPWGRDEPSPDAERLARAALADPGALPAVLRYVAHHVARRADRAELVPLAFDLLGRAAAAGGCASHDVRTLAEAVVPIDPIGAARAALAALPERTLRNLWEADELDAVLQAAWATPGVDRRALFAEVIGPWVDREDVLTWTLREALRGVPLTDLGADALLTWVSGAPEPRAYRLAALLGAPGDPASDLHGLLLERYDAEGVGDAFRSAFLTGQWVGLRSDRTRSQLTRARGWAADPRPAVKAWGREMVTQLEGQLRRDEQEEAEERLFR